MNKLSFENQVVVVTGAGNGLGRAYAHELARRGAKVVVNDIGQITNEQGNDTPSADTVVKEITDAGGEAIANYDSVVQGSKVIASAIEKWGRVDILVNNAGIANACPYSQMTDEIWQSMLEVHLEGSHACTRAAWSHMEKQKYGRIIFTTSPVGLHGWENFSHYGTAKAGIIGLSRALSVEGAQHNILSNAVAPFASTGMTGGATSEHQDNSKVSPGYVAQLVAWLAHESTTETGSVFEAGGGIVHKVKWALSKAMHLEGDECTAENIASNTDTLNDFTKPIYPVAGDPYLIGKELAGDKFLELFF